MSSQKPKTLAQDLHRTKPALQHFSMEWEEVHKAFLLTEKLLIVDDHWRKESRFLQECVPWCIVLAVFGGAPPMHILASPVGYSRL